MDCLPRVARAAGPSEPGGIDEFDDSPHSPLELLDLAQQSRDHRIAFRERGKALLAARTVGIGHTQRLRTMSHHAVLTQFGRAHPEPDTINQQRA